MPLPVIAAILAGAATLVLYAVATAIEIWLRTANAAGASELQWSTIVLIGLACVSIAAALAYGLAWLVGVALDNLGRYLTQTGGEAPATLHDVPLAELRRLRVGIARTVGRLQRENQRLRNLAFVDAQTGLATPILLNQQIAKTLGAATFEAPAAFMVLDLDGFGRVFEQAGTERSERVIAASALRLKQALAEIDAHSGRTLRGSVLAHIHADVFALYLPEAISRQHVTAVARAIRDAFTLPFDVDGFTVTLGISGGIVIAPEDADAPLILRAHAELALKQARREQGTGFRFYSPRLNRVVRGRYLLEAELREAINNREFNAVFQPKIDFITGRIVGAEALARWRRPNGKVISPAAFIPLAEETGLITEISEQMMELACLAARDWMQDGHAATVAVNVSPRQLQRDDLTDMVLMMLKRTGLPANRLELEITESMAVSNPAKVADVMRPLRALGIKLAIDDFGTGHSNLATLTQLPFDVFKIDRQFVSALDSDQQAPAIVEMILAMAETLGLKTVAEGVETAQQADFLRRRGCTMAQGYLYSPGLPQAAFKELLRAWRPVSILDQDGRSVQPAS
jgi:EAL domain-containing protein (putative c-di-GMP-specific phosphodiesterase class I)/GGDEF domain-containing protein